MDKDFLVNYESEEKIDIDSFIEKTTEGKFGATERFPKLTRFNKIKMPITYMGETSAPLWSTVAFSGSTIIPLLPTKERYFSEMHGFQPRQINDMVDFSKETGKIQFVLLKQPTAYEGLEFLNPIFEELKPPLFAGIPLDAFAPPKVYQKFDIEFSTLSQLGYSDYLYNQLSMRYDSNLIDIYIHNLKGNYIMLKLLLADSELSDSINDAIVSDYKKADRLIDMLDRLVLRPIRNPLRCAESYSIKNLRQDSLFDNKLKNGKMFPCEIGSFLLSELVHYPESFEACKQLLTIYEEEDVIKILNALNNAIKSKKSETIQSNQLELSRSLKSIWENKAIKYKIQGVKFGIPVILGALGTAIAGLSGGYTGLLSGIGFDVVDKLLEIKTEAFSEKLAKSLSNDYQATIFDFQKRYKI